MPFTRRPTRLTLPAISALLALAPAAQGQPFDPGPPGTAVGSSMSGARIGALPRRPARGLPNAEVFGDTVEERAYGRAFDDSYLTPEIRRPRGAPPIELRATEGRSDLNDVNAGAYARGEANIGAGPVTRPSLEGRRIARPPANGRARIRR